jgi:Xaa-Pro dipeptidase
MIGNTSIRIQEGTGDLIGSLPFSASEYQGRLDRLRALMQRRRLDALITFTPENLYYLTGHDSPGYYFYEASVITHGKPPINVLRRAETTNTLWLSWPRLTVSYEDREDPIDTTVRLLHELGVATGVVGAEADAWFVTPKRYDQLRALIARAGGQLVETSGLIEELRAIKSPAEIAYIRQGARICERAMTRAIEASHEGTNENAVASAAIAELIRNGSEYAGLPPFITSGRRTALCHSTWSGRVYETGDVLAYELPGVVRRYCAALFRVGTVGPPGDDAIREASIVREALEAVIGSIRPGITSERVHGASKTVFEKHGYGHRIAHRTGYSIGINYAPDWGEGQIMSLWENDQRPLRAGMTFHLVPACYHEPHSIITISETVLVTDGGCEVLTHFPRELFRA